MNNILMSVVETAADVTTVDTLGIMGKGMLGIFVVTALIVLVVNALNNIPEKKNKEDK